MHPKAYDVLSDPNLRAAYNQELQQAILDETDGFTGDPDPPSRPSTMRQLLTFSPEPPPPLPLLPPYPSDDEESAFLPCPGKPLSKWAVGTSMGKNEDPGETRAVFVVSLSVRQSPILLVPQLLCLFPITHSHSHSLPYYRTLPYHFHGLQPNIAYIQHRLGRVPAAASAG